MDAYLRCELYVSMCGMMKAILYNYCVSRFSVKTFRLLLYPIMYYNSIVLRVRIQILATDIISMQHISICKKVGIIYVSITNY